METKKCLTNFFSRFSDTTKTGERQAEEPRSRRAPLAVCQSSEARGGGGL